MPLLVTSVPNLAQGVSQQPDNLRYPGQCDEQINAWSTVVEGLVKRPNTRWIKEFNSGSSPTNLFTHFVKRSEQNKYCVTVSLGGVGVINLEDGESIPVATTSIAGSYLSLGSSVTNPLADLRALTVADYTFLLNKKRVVERSTESEQKSKAPPDEALIVVKLGDYEKHYTVIIDDLTIPNINTGTLNYHKAPQLGSGSATYESGGSSNGWHADTNVIAEDISEIIKGALEISNDSVTSIDININTDNTGWAGGKSTGKWVFDAAGTMYDVEYKLELEISQSGAGTAYCEAIVENGVIVGFRNFRRGRDFDATQNITITYKQWIKQRRYDAGAASWELLKPGDNFYRTIPAGFGTSTPGGVTSDPLHVNLQTLGATSYEVEQENSVIKITSQEGPFKIRVKDGLADQGLGIVYREVNSITDLPVQCYNGFGPVKVIGDADIDQDDYYVRFSTKDKGDFGEGSWVETVGYYQDESESSQLEGIDTLLATSTMPVTLVPFFNNNTITDFRLQTPNDLLYVENDGGYYRLNEDHTATASNEPGVGASWEDYWSLVDETFDTNAAVGNLVWREGTFYYGPKSTITNIGWSSRQAGDDKTNPFPSFVGSTINDIFFFKNRLGLLTDSHVIFSEADEYYNFFRTTTQQLLDSAPIDVGLSHTKVALLKNAIPFQEKLMLFSDNSQFVLRGADVLSPKTVAISPVTDYDIADGIEPLNLGSYIYFPFKRGEYAGVLEYFVDNNTEVFEAEEITSQIPKYIPSNIKTMVGSSSENMILIQAEDEPKSLYVYKYYWTNKEKIQSAWMKWTFDDDITGLNFIDSTLYLILNGKVLVQAPVENALVDTGLDYTLLLDNRVDGDGLTVSYNSQDNETTISNLPSGYGVDVTVDNEGNVTSTNVAVYTKGGSGRTISGSGASTTVKIKGFIASYVDNGGDYVQYNGEYYYCIYSHTSTSTFENQYWRKAAYPPSDVTDWASATSYSRGTIYKCEHDQTVQALEGIHAHTSSTATEPGVGADWADYWEVSTEVPSAPEWGPNIFYNDQYYFVVGKPYDMLYRFSNQALKQPTERGGRSASDYTFQSLRNGSIEYADSGHFTVEVTPRFRDTYTYVYNPALLSSISTLDRFTPESGHFRFGIQCRPEEATIEVKSSSALPVKLLAAEFESMVTGRSKRYGA